MINMCSFIRKLLATSTILLAATSVQGGSIMIDISTPTYFGPGTQSGTDEYYSDFTLTNGSSSAIAIAGFFLGFSSSDVSLAGFDDATDQVNNYIFANNSFLDSAPYTGDVSIFIPSQSFPNPPDGATDLAITGATVVGPGQTVGLARVYFDYAMSSTPTVQSLSVVTDPTSPFFTQFSDENANSLVASISATGGGTYDVTIATVPEPPAALLACQGLLLAAGFVARERKRRANQRPGSDRSRLASPPLLGLASVEVAAEIASGSVQ
jgi:hypothetical protein